MNDLTTTERGFSLLNFRDINKRACSLQESSLAMVDCIWLGCNDIGLRKFVPGTGWTDIKLENGFPDGVSYQANTRMHLTRDQVAALLPHLQRFVETGSLDGG